MKPIHARDNPTFRRLRAIATDAGARKSENRTLLEGEHLVRAWLDARRPIETLAIDARTQGDAAIDRCVARAAAEGAETLALDAALMRALSSLESPARIVAVAAPVHATLELLRGLDAVALDAVQDPGNVGAILRTAAAAGVAGVLLGAGCASAWAPKVLRAGMGAHAALAIVEVDDLATAIATLDVPVIGTVLEPASEDLYAIDLRAPLVWVFGHEGQGVCAEVAARLDRRVRIPQSPQVESLNVAAAAAVCLFEMRRQRMR